MPVLALICLHQTPAKPTTLTAMKYLPYVILVPLVAAVAILFVLYSNLKTQLEGGAPAAYASHSSHPKGEAEEFEVAIHMSHMQRYADKLYFAGIAGNGPLVEFYLHEIEETAEGIANAKVVDEGVDVSNLITTILMPEIERFEKSMADSKGQSFKEDYAILVSTCNKCHTLAKHDYIQIKTPDQPTYRNQDFAPKTK